jgi:hypothetical protein
MQNLNNFWNILVPENSASKATIFIHQNKFVQHIQMASRRNNDLMNWVQVQIDFYIKKKILSSRFIRCHLVSVVVRVLTLHISIFVSEATWHIRTKLCKNVHQMVLYKVWVIVVDRRFNIAARTNNTFWLSEIINLLIRKNREPIGLWYCSNAH